MSFTKYSSITNAYKDEYIAKCFMEVPDDIRWVATEKLHGCNFSFLVDNSGVKHCSRNNVLTMETKFYNHTIHKREHQNMIDIFEWLSAIYKDVEAIQVYGEYVGPNIQKGIDYGAEAFYCFDIKIYYKDGTSQYCDFPEVRALCIMFNVGLVPVVGEGTLEEMLKLPNEFQSLIYPTDKENICEGIVIKPIIPFYLRNGDRVIIKSKNDKWAEKASKPKAPKKPISASVKTLLNEFTIYITEGRVQNVISKDPEFQDMDNKKFGKLIQAIIDDICKEEGFTADQIKPAKKYISREIANVARKVVFNG